MARIGLAAGNNTHGNVFVSTRTRRRALATRFRPAPLSRFHPAESQHQRLSHCSSATFCSMCLLWMSTSSTRCRLRPILLVVGMSSRALYQVRNADLIQQVNLPDSKDCAALMHLNLKPTVCHRVCTNIIATSTPPVAALFCNQHWPDQPHNRYRTLPRFTAACFVYLCTVNLSAISQTSLPRLDQSCRHRLRPRNACCVGSFAPTCIIGVAIRGFLEDIWRIARRLPRGMFTASAGWRQGNEGCRRALATTSAWQPA